LVRSKITKNVTARIKINNYLNAGYLGLHLLVQSYRVIKIKINIKYTFYIIKISVHTMFILYFVNLRPQLFNKKHEVISI